MKGLLVRIGADQSPGGGRWNGPVDTRAGRFCYVPIPETKPNRPGLERPYTELAPVLDSMGTTLPAHLASARMHLDPDFEHLTYGDRGRKGQQLSNTLGEGDLLVFYSGLKDVHTRKLLYAIIGLFVVDRIVRAKEQPDSDATRNAHTRRILTPDSDDVIVLARQDSGRLRRCIEIGEFRDRAYRVRKDLLRAWGGISANDGYLQRSAVFPSLLKAQRFWDWWLAQNPSLVHSNYD